MRWTSKLEPLFIFACVLILFTARADASSCSVNPSTPACGHPVTVIYDPAGGPLAGAATVYAHKGENGWNNVEDVAMTLSNGVWYVTYLVPQWTYGLNCVFTDLAGTWDNNSGNDWYFSVPLPSVGAPPALPDNASRANVMMQGFYWDCPGGWYNNYLAPRAKSLRYMRGGQGIDRIWFPPASKGAGGGTTMGYDPYDYYDVGQYTQKGTTRTRFGTQTALINAIAAFRARGIVSMADLVFNHRDGGASEYNPNIGGSTPTDFSGVASGMCTWHYNEFHPSTHEAYDEGSFASFQDVCHVTGDTAGSAYYDLIEWGNWLTNTANAGFDGGWRIDYPKGIHPSFIADFRKGTGDAFGILEYWDGNMSLIEDYVKYSGNTSAFDFPAFYTMADVFNNGGYIPNLIDSSKVYAAKNPARAVTFVANHDTENNGDVISNNTMLAYAFILTYQGYPCIFWKDYYNDGLATLGGQRGNGIKPLVWVRGALGGGQPSIQLLKTNDSDFLIYGTLNGSVSAPGYIVAINNHPSSVQSTTVTTANTFLRGKTLQCHAWYSYNTGQNSQPANVSCSSGGIVTVQAPPNGYAVYSVTTNLPSPWVATDVGSEGLDGMSIFYSDTFTISGSGPEIDGTGDGFHYVYQTNSGGCAIQARVKSLENTGLGAKSGIMIREDTTTNSMNAAVVVTSEDGVEFQWRDSTGSSTASTTAAGIAAPCWLRLVRSGNLFHGYYSLDGTSWTQIGSAQTITMSSNATMGLVSTSGTNDALNTCSIDSVDVNAAPVSTLFSNQYLVAGNTVTLTNMATDADVPAQTLTQSLVDAPTGATFNSGSGVFSWRPQIEQSPSTQTVAIAISDNGMPPLTTTNSFVVTVSTPSMPTLSSVVVTNDVVGFWIGGDAGPDYTILGSTNLLSGAWTPMFATNAPSLPFFWSAPTSGVQQEFYKVELGP